MTKTVQNLSTSTQFEQHLQRDKVLPLDFQLSQVQSQSPHDLAGAMRFLETLPIFNTNVTIHVGK